MQKKRGKSDSDDDFVPGKTGKMKARGAKKTPESTDDAVSSDATDDLYELFEPESEEEVRASPSSSSEHLDSDGSEYVPRGRNAKRAAAIKGNFRYTDCCCAIRYMSSSVCLSTVTFLHPTQAIQIFRNVFTPFGTLAISDLSIKILRRSTEGNPSSGGLNRRGVAKYSNFGPFRGFISEIVQDTK